MSNLMQNDPSRFPKPVHATRLRRVGGILAALVVAGMLASATDARAAALDVNSASAAELEALPGIGAAKAAAIVEERQVRPFASIEDLERVRGIGPALVAELRPHITVSPAAASKPR
jgi:competence protein ComEA